MTELSWCGDLGYVVVMMAGDRDDVVTVDDGDGDVTMMVY